MKYLLKLCIVLALNVVVGRSQLFQQKVNCKTFADPMNCNAYYQCCVNNVILHKFCPVGLEWNAEKEVCDSNELCQNVEILTDVEDKNEIYFENYSSCMDIADRKRRPIVRPPVVRPPSSGSIEIKLNIEVYLMMLANLVIFHVFRN